MSTVHDCFSQTDSWIISKILRTCDSGFAVWALVVGFRRLFSPMLSLKLPCETSHGPKPHVRSQ